MTATVASPANRAVVTEPCRQYQSSFRSHGRNRWPSRCKPPLFRLRPVATAPSSSRRSDSRPAALAERFDPPSCPRFALLLSPSLRSTRHFSQPIWRKPSACHAGLAVCARQPSRATALIDLVAEPDFGLIGDHAAASALRGGACAAAVPNARGASGAGGWSEGGSMDGDVTLQFLNHASVKISTPSVTIVSDPWFSGSIFNHGWDLLWTSDAIAPLAADTDFIWISHE